LLIFRRTRKYIHFQVLCFRLETKDENDNVAISQIEEWDAAEVIHGIGNDNTILQKDPRVGKAFLDTVFGKENA